MELVVNGGSYSLEAPVGRSLAETLRDALGLTGTKIGCNEGHCGACTVLVDGAPVRACLDAHVPSNIGDLLARNAATAAR